MMYANNRLKSDCNSAALHCNRLAGAFALETPLLIQILKRTPLWVFVLFFVLLTLGYFQSKGRTVSLRKFSILPTAMIVLSFYGVLSAFGIVPIGLVFWVLGVLIAVGIILARQLPIASERTFVGSVSLCYGLFSGLFLARAIVMWRFAMRYR